MSLKNIDVGFVKQQIEKHKSLAGKEPVFDMVVLLGEKCLELMNQDKKRFDDLNQKGNDAVNRCRELATELKRERKIVDLLMMYQNRDY